MSPPVQILAHTLGLALRLFFVWTVPFIVGNAFYTLWFRSHEEVIAVLAVVFFPATYIAYPFLHPAEFTSWPFAAGTALWPFFLGGWAAWALSNLLGVDQDLHPFGRWM